MAQPNSQDAAPADTLWDVLVVGTGMGGSTLGHELARRGRRVLFLERGHFLFGGADRGKGTIPFDADDSPESRLRRGHWPLPLQGRTSFGTTEFFAPLGCGSGGSSGLYAAQLERLLPVDFEPRANYPEAGDSTLPESWPISYAEFLPWYRRAEQLYGVRGTPDPLNPDPDSALREPPPLSARDQDFDESFRALGLHPYRAHVACEYLPGCLDCGGVLCPRACKNDAGRTCLVPALEQHGARILADCEVTSLEADARAVQRVHCRWKGQPLALRARVVVLAAGALMTPTLLLNSVSQAWPNGLANSSGMVGRNLMFHASDFIAVRPRRSLSALGPKKALSFNDFYVHAGRKLGTFQSVGVGIDRGSILYFLKGRMQKSPAWQRKLASPFLRAVSILAALHFRGAGVFASIIEDLPYLENRVVPDPQAKNGMRFEYRYTGHLRERTRLYRRLLARTLAPHHRMMVLTGADNINYGHTCGTCRFGNDARSSVLDRDNRAHEVENLYVVDASFFPSSGGTNPSLTIAANALRVAQAIEGQLARGLVGSP
jgi:choline dehydrogenase-like flavoprotein